MDLAFWLSIVLGCFCCLALTLFAVFKYFMGNKGYWPSHGMSYVDMDKRVPFMDRLSFKYPFHTMEAMMYEECKKAPGPAAGLLEFRRPILVLTDLDLIKRITTRDFDHFVNRRAFNPVGKNKYSAGKLLFKQDQDWRDLRSTLTPTFTPANIKRMFNVFTECGHKMTNFLESETQKRPDGSVDVRDCMTRYTIDVIASAAFGVESHMFEDKNSPFGIMCTRLQNAFKGLKIFKLLAVALFPKLLAFFKVQLIDEEPIEFFADMVRDTIRKREESGEVRNDFVQLLIEAKADNSGKTALTTDLIISQSLLFFLAGFDTVETLMIFLIYELGLNPEVQDTLFQEVDKAMKKNGGLIDYDMINHLEYMDRVVSETLRKYPPAIRTERTCSQDYPLPNTKYVVKKGDLVIIPMYGIHHDKEYFPDPDKFDPDRFTPENIQQRPQYSYFPFGSGPRSCIAMRFALVEGKTALAHLIHSFQIHPCGKTDIPIKVGKLSAFKPDGELWFKLTRRLPAHAPTS